jgi:uncharacterized protein YegL
MNTNLFNVVKECIARYGDSVLFDHRRVKSLLADLAQDIPKPQKNAFIKCLEYGFVQLLKNGSAQNRADIKQQLAQRLHEEEGLDLGLCGDTLDLLAAALFGEEQQKTPSQTESGSILFERPVIMRRAMVLFFVIGTSGSMDGSKIGSVNTAIEEFIPVIREVSDENPDAEIRIAVLEFSSGARWITASPIPVEQFRWNYLEAGGLADFGDACKAMNKKLSATMTFMRSVGYNFYLPVMVLLSGSEPTDEWEKPLKELWQNRFFQVSNKVAIAIGDNANKDLLKEFTGTMERVFEPHNIKAIEKMIFRLDDDVRLDMDDEEKEIISPDSCPSDGDWE